MSGGKSLVSSAYFNAAFISDAVPTDFFTTGGDVFSASSSNPRIESSDCHPHKDWKLAVSSRSIVLDATTFTSDPSGRVQTVSPPDFLKYDERGPSIRLFRSWSTKT